MNNTFQSDADGDLTAEALIIQNIARVGYLVHEVASRLPAHADLDALRSAGLLGLVQAAAAYNPDRGVPFRHYATTRIRGAILDEMRTQDWTSRSMRQAGRRRDHVVEQLTMALGRTPNTHEIAEYLNISIAELSTVESALHRSAVLSLDAAPSIDAFEASMPHDGVSPEESVIDQEEQCYLYAAIRTLPERLRKVVVMYFIDGLPMAEIAEVLQVTESRVSQMRAEALAMMRDGINSQLNPDQVSEVKRPGGVVERRRSAYFAAIAQEGRMRQGRAAHEYAHREVTVAERRMNGLA